MDRFELSVDRLHDRRMQFLKNASPDDWHRYAANHNWDEPLVGLFWIVSQPTCDRATAMLVFWKGEPASYDFETDDGKMGDDEYAVAPMLRYIVERFNSTGYSRSEIAYDVLEDHGIDLPEYQAMGEARRQADIEALIERQRNMANPLVKLHPDLKLLRVAGRKVGGIDDDSDYYRLFPDDVDDAGSEAQPQPGEASSGIRALRRQGGEASGAASDDQIAAKSRATSRGSAGSGAPADLRDVLFDPLGMMANMAGLGFAIGFVPQYAASHSAGALFWVAAIAAIIYCLYASFSNFRKMQHGVAAQGVVIAPGWIAATTTIALLSGMGVGHIYLMLLNDHTMTRVTRYGFIIAAVTGLIVLSFALARSLLVPQARRDA